MIDTKEKIYQINNEENIKEHRAALKTKIIVVADDEFYGDILVETNDNHKCDRCWHKHESVGSINRHEKLCNRCHDNIFGDGEKRLLG